MLPFKSRPSSVARSLGAAALLGVSSRIKPGTNVFSKDWDLLVILDTCRPDGLQEVSGQADFIPDEVDTIWSVGSSTREWVGNTFIKDYKEEIQETAVITANAALSNGTQDKGWSVLPDIARRVTNWSLVDEDDIGYTDNVWKYGPVDPWTGTSVPWGVTDRAISVGRKHNYDRDIVHYICPHSPYRSRSMKQNRPPYDHERYPWEHIDSNIDNDVWEVYLDEIRWVLEYVEMLLNNFDADNMVISADHGDLFGELGIKAHPDGVPHPGLRRVPWVKTEANDTGSYVPSIEPQNESSSQHELESQLRELGYIE